MKHSDVVLSNEEIERRLLEVVDDPYFKNLNLPLWFYEKHPHLYDGNIPLERLIDLEKYNREYNALTTSEERKQYSKNRLHTLLVNYYKKYNTLPQNIHEF